MLVRSLLFSAMSGKVGGVVGSRNSSGSYIRNHTVPVNPNTARQQAARTALATVAARWRDTLTAAQRQAWTNYASSFSWTNKLGDAITLTGQQAYMGSQAARAQAALALVDEGPVAPGLPEFTTPSVTTDATTPTAPIAFTSADAWHASGGAMLVFMSPPQSPSVNVYVGPYKYAGKIVSTDISPHSLPMPDGAPGIIGAKTFCQIRVTMPDGRLSTPRQVVSVATDA